MQNDLTLEHFITRSSPWVRSSSLIQVALIVLTGQFASASWAMDANQLADSPRPAGQQQTANAPTPCEVKRASFGMAWEAAETAPTSTLDPAAAAATAAIGVSSHAVALSRPEMPADEQVHCSLLLPILGNLGFIGKLPVVNWYARFLNGPQVKPMTPKEKAWLAVRNVADPFNSLTILGSSAISVAADSHSAYGPGMRGFGRYVGVSYTQDMTGEFFGTFLIPSIMHQDPHYHRMPNASVKHRIFHAASQVIWTQGDSGKGMLNYADLAGFAIDDEIGNLYIPGRETNAEATASRYAIGLATAPIDNFITEFLPDVARKIHIRVVLIQQIINQVALKDSTSGQP